MTLATQFVHEMREKCPECEGTIYRDDDWYEAMCEGCNALYDLKDASDVDQEDVSSNILDDIIDGEFTAQHNDDEEEGVIRGEPRQAQSQGLDLAFQTLSNRVEAMETRLTDLERIHVPEVIERPTLVNIFMDGTREFVIMDALLDGPKTLEELKEVIPRNRGKAPADKTVAGWVMELDRYRKFRVGKDEEGKYVIEERA